MRVRLSPIEEQSILQQTSIKPGISGGAEYLGLHKCPLLSGRSFPSFPKSVLLYQISESSLYQLSVLPLS